MSEGGFLLVTREGKIWKAPRRALLAGASAIALPAARDRATFVNIWRKYLVTRSRLAAAPARSISSNSARRATVTGSPPRIPVLRRRRRADR